jgi:hypothetical protein
MNPQISGLTSRISKGREPPTSGPLAQLVEQLTFNQWVAGSNPARLTTEIKDLDGFQEGLLLNLVSF